MQVFNIISNVRIMINVSVNVKDLFGTIVNVNVINHLIFGIKLI